MLIDNAALISPFLSILSSPRISDYPAKSHPRQQEVLTETGSPLMYYDEESCERLCQVCAFQSRFCNLPL